MVTVMAAMMVMVMNWRLLRAQHKSGGEQGTGD